MTSLVVKLEALESARVALHECLGAAHMELCSARLSSNRSCDISVESVPQELQAVVHVQDLTLRYSEIDAQANPLKWFGERPSNELTVAQQLFREALEKCMKVIQAEAAVAAVIAHV